MTALRCAARNLEGCFRCSKQRPLAERETAGSPRVRTRNRFSAPGFATAERGDWPNGSSLIRQPATASSNFSSTVPGLACWEASCPRMDGSAWHSISLPVAIPRCNMNTDVTV